MTKTNFAFLSKQCFFTYFYWEMINSKHCSWEECKRDSQSLKKNWSQSQNKCEKSGKKAKYAVFHGVTRQPGNVLKKVETSGGGGGGVLWVGEGTPV